MNHIVQLGDVGNTCSYYVGWSASDLCSTWMSDVKRRRQMFDGRSQMPDYLRGGSLQERDMLQPGFLIYTCLERNNWDTVKDNFLKPGRVNTEYCSPMN